MIDLLKTTISEKGEEVLFREVHKAGVLMK